MKLFRMLGRNIRDAAKGVIRNFSLSFASVSCITITLIVVSISILLSTNVNNFADIIKSDVTVVVFLEKNIGESDKEEILDNIKKLDNIESFEEKDRFEVANDMMKESDDLKSIMSTWTVDKNPLRDTILVKVKNVESIGKTAEKINSFDNVYTVKYGEGMVEQLLSAFKMVEKISFGMVIALIFVTAFLISNTIKVAIFSRKREIEIMRLVGASNFTIKTPFVIEGMFLGLIGSIIPILVSIYGYTLLYNTSGGQIFSAIIKLVPPEPFIYTLAGLLLIIGMVVGMIGSSRAVRAHLKI